jgi:hypothetical protein
MDKYLKCSLILANLLASFSFGLTQVCDENRFLDLLNEAEILSFTNKINKKELMSTKNQLENYFQLCWDKESCPQQLYKKYLLNMMHLSDRLSDIENRVFYLEQMRSVSPNSSEWGEINIDQQLAIVKANYGSLKIGIDSDMLSEMAVLKDENGSNIRIHFLIPPNVWTNETYEYREERKARLKYIVDKSSSDDLQLFFDSYSYEDSMFYFEIPYVPYLDFSDNSEDWYGITFNEQKRYRVKFSPPSNASENVPPLIIQPENNWTLETSIPEHYVKLNYRSGGRRLKFYDRESGQRLSRDEFIIIKRDNNVTDYYLPSDRNLKIEIPDHPSKWHNVLGVSLYGLVGLGLGYIAYLGVN